MQEIVVIVPAADEQDYIEACLTSLRTARAQLGRQAPEVNVRLVVVLDACVDRTKSIVDAHQEVESVTVSERCVGAARRAGADHALAGAGYRLPDTWLASTDADSRVPPDWLVGVHRAAQAGYHAVLGTVALDDGLPERVEQQWSIRHEHVNGHPHVHGANIAVRADAYRAVGGWPLLITGEDIELARRLGDKPGLSVLRSATHPVITSVRTHGRAPDGFAGYLTDLVLDGAEQELRIEAISRRTPLTSTG